MCYKSTRLTIGVNLVQDVGCLCDYFYQNSTVFCWQESQIVLHSFFGWRRGNLLRYIQYHDSSSYVPYHEYVGGLSCHNNMLFLFCAPSLIFLSERNLTDSYVFSRLWFSFSTQTHSHSNKIMSTSSLRYFLDQRTYEESARRKMGKQEKRASLHHYNLLMTVELDTGRGWTATNMLDLNNRMAAWGKTSNSINFVLLTLLLQLA